MNLQKIGVLTVVGLVAFSGLAMAQTFTLNQSVAFSVIDQPRDGLGDAFESTFTGLIREQSTRENRAMQEFDLTPLLGASVATATIAGTVNVNNAFNNGLRTFEFQVYAGNGVADLSDFEITATPVGTGSYDPPNTSSFTYSFDITAELNNLLNTGNLWLGFRCDPTSDPNFPNILATTTTITVTTGFAPVANDLGGGCDFGGGPAPVLTMPTPPSIGTTTGFDVATAPNTVGELLFSFGQPTPLPLGSGCTLHIDLNAYFTFVPFVTDGTGNFSFPIPLPGDPALVGGTYTFQAYTLPGGGAALTNGLLVVIGN